MLVEDADILLMVIEKSIGEVLYVPLLKTIVPENTPEIFKGLETLIIFEVIFELVTFKNP